MKTCLSIAIAIVLFLAWYSAVKAGEVSLEWDAVTDARVAKYELHYGLATGAYTSKVTVPKTATEATVTGLPAKRHFFAVRACNEAITQCSLFSNEVSAVIPADIAAPIQLKVGSITVNISIGD